MGVEQFYGITTTTLVVLSSATLVIFQFLLADFNKKLEQLNNKLVQLISLKDNTKNIDISNSFSIKSKVDELKNKIKKYEKPLRIEFFLFFIIIFYSSLSVFIVLLNSVFDNISIDIRVILLINLLAIIIYICAFLSLVFRLINRRKKVRLLDIDFDITKKNIKETFTQTISKE